jgi:DNA polymerase III epsilon subunit-like protein
MIDIALDCETTGINPYYSEVIEAYFYIDDNNAFHLKARPDNWCYEAEQIHKISYAQASTYPDKKTAYRELLQWLPKDFRFISYVNKNTELGTINFDVACIWNELNLLGMPQYHLENVYKMKPPISILDLARKAANNGLYQPLKGKSGRVSYSQENTYKALFNEKYNAHDAKEDVLALVRIHKELVRLNNENQSLLKFC